MQSRAAAPISRTDRAPARPFGSTETRTGAFSRGLDGAQNVASASLAPAAEKAQQPAGRGLLSTGVQFILAETRTQEAGAPLPPVSNLSRARDSYLTTQASVRETIAINRAFSTPTQASPSEGAQAYQQQAAFQPAGALGALADGNQSLPGASVPSQADDEFDSDYY